MMTVLRSRKILSSVTPKALSREKAVTVPATPSRTFELLNQSASMTTTPTSSFPAQEFSLGSGDVMVSGGGSGSGMVRRRSARLAGKSGLENIEVVSVKRKKVKGNEECEVRNSEGVEDMDDVVAADSGSGDDSHDMEVSKVVTISGRRKRKPRLEPKSLGFEKNGVEKKSMGLRSGKRVRKEMKDDGCSSAGIGDTKESCLVSNGYAPVDTTKLGVNGEEDEKDYPREKIGSRGDKGKSKVGCETSANGDSFPINLQLDDSCPDASNLPGSVGPSIPIETGVKTRGRLSREEKGKAKLVVDASSNYINTAEVAKTNAHKRSDSDVDQLETNVLLIGAQPQPQPQPVVDNVPVNNARDAHRERFRNFARRNASRFAHFSSGQEFGSSAPDDGAGSSHRAQTEVEDWPGPFSTAMKIIKDRGTNKSGARQDDSKCETAQLKWIPKKHDVGKCEKQSPTLQDLCLSVLSKNAGAITSLDYVPDALRHKISYFLCDGRGMNGDFIELLVHDSPTEIRIRDCSWLTEELVTKIFEGLDASKLTVFQFDLCGSCMPDYTLHTTLAHSPNCLPVLTTISLKGAYRLQDTGLSLLASAAPSLKSIDLGQCPLLTSVGITSLLNSLRLVIRELYLDNSNGVDAMLILPALLELECLEVLSLAGIQTVSDDFISKFISVKGFRMKELNLADCVELTDLSLEVIGATCSELRAVDLSNLCKLTDVSIGHLANGCPAIDILKVCRNEFSDEGVAAYLDVHGSSLKDLSLNSIIQVSNHTAISLARNCRNLRRLDLSWCRKLSNEALGLIVDSCSQLEVLKLFGCTQITNVFLNGHSNRKVKLIGLKMSPIIENIEVPDFLQGPLRYSSIAC